MQLTLVTPSFPVQKMTTHLASHIFRGKKRQRRETWHRNTFLPRNFVPTNEGKAVRKYCASYKWRFDFFFPDEKMKCILTLTYSTKISRAELRRKTSNIREKAMPVQDLAVDQLFVQCSAWRAQKNLPCMTMHCYATLCNCRA